MCFLTSFDSSPRWGGWSAEGRGWYCKDLLYHFLIHEGIVGLLQADIVLVLSSIHPMIIPEQMYDAVSTRPLLLHFTWEKWLNECCGHDRWSKLKGTRLVEGIIVLKSCIVYWRSFCFLLIEGKGFLLLSFYTAAYMDWFVLVHSVLQQFLIDNYAGTINCTTM